MFSQDAPSSLRRWGRFSFLAVIAALVLPACSPRVEQHAFTGPTQGTTYSVKVIAALSRGERAEVQKVIDARLAAVDAAMSLYKEDSELSRFNASESTAPFPASSDLVAVFELAHQVSEVTGGAFDVTVKPLVDCWGFGAGGERTPPSAEELAELRAHVGYGKVEAGADGESLRKVDPEVYCDLNAIAQGYTVDLLAEDLTARGFTDFMVEVGGEVKAMGVNGQGVPWRIGIEKPQAGLRGIQRVVSLRDTALATSGNYRRFREQNGIRISHTIDPRIGAPVEHGLASASVIHSSCAMADAYATALMVLGPVEGYAFATRLDLAALLIVHTGEGYEEKETPGFGRVAIDGAE